MEHTEIQNVSGTYYVRGQMSGETISPPYADRGDALAKADEIEALPADERKRVLAGRKPAPGCTWLIGGERGELTIQERIEIAANDENPERALRDLADDIANERPFSAADYDRVIDQLDTLRRDGEESGS